MEIKNSGALIVSKFSVMYRVLLYVFISLLIVMAFGTSIIVPAINKVFKAPETFEIFERLTADFSQFMEGNLTIRAMYDTLKTEFNSFLGLLKSSSAPATLWVAIIVIYLLSRFAISSCYIVITDIFHLFMSSDMYYSFTSNMAKNFKQSMRFSLSYTLVSVPADALIAAVILGLSAALWPIMKVFSLAFVLVAAVVLFALKTVLFCQVAPIMTIEEETNFFKAFKKSLPMLKKFFSSYFSSMVMMLLVFYCLIVILTPITFGVAFIVLTALLITYVHVMSLVYYYGYNRMRYYVDNNTIVDTAPIYERADMQDRDDITFSGER